jgi:hypothetical protein
VRANEILEVLFNKTLQNGHWKHVQFGTKKNNFQRNYGILSLVVLTWLRQLQQFFLNKEKKLRIGTGTFLENILVQPLTI